MQIHIVDRKILILNNKRVEIKQQRQQCKIYTLKVKTTIKNDNEKLTNN